MPCKSSRLVGAVLGAHSSESCCSIRFRNQDCLSEPTPASPRRDMSTTPTPLSYSPSPSLETNYRYNALQRCPRRGASQTKPEPCDSTHDFIAKHEPHHPYPPDPSDRIAHGRMTVTAHTKRRGKVKRKTRNVNETCGQGHGETQAGLPSLAIVRAQVTPQALWWDLSRDEFGIGAVRPQTPPG